MQRPEKTISMLLIPAIVVFSMYIALMYLPILQVRDLDVSVRPTAGMMRTLLPMKGRSYLSTYRNGVMDNLSSLPYLEEVSPGYDKGTMTVAVRYREGGINLVSGKSAAVLYGDEIIPVELEDTAALSSVYPTVFLSESFLEYFTLFGIPEKAVEVLRMAEDAWRSTSLITWMEYGNNSNGDSPVLTMQIPSLNASLSIMDADAAVRIEESIAIIEDEHVRGGADAVLGDEAHYGLYNDGLVRMKRQQHGGR